jgi:hypothetical protein
MDPDQLKSLDVSDGTAMTSVIFMPILAAGRKTYENTGVRRAVCGNYLISTTSDRAKLTY